jgi:colanic acid/amylovoran biosynthesis glycosyltransferase
MEAMSTGLPVVSTYHSAIPELITHGVDGFLVEERNINEYTKTLFDLKNCSTEIGLRASEKVSKNFNLLTETKKLFDLYESVM